MRPIALDKWVFVGEREIKNAFHDLVWAKDLKAKGPPDIYCNWCHKKWHRWAKKMGFKPRWLSKPCPAKELACGHPAENHGPIGELAPGRRFNFNIFGDCDDENS